RRRARAPARALRARGGGALPRPARGGRPALLLHLARPLRGAQRAARRSGARRREAPREHARSLRERRVLAGGAGRGRVRALRLPARVRARRGAARAAQAPAAARPAQDPEEAAVSDAEARRRIAEDLDQSFVVEAAAGTGKTTALIGRMIALIRTGRARLEEIVAVTFTEKAAGEMKLRLRTELERACSRASGADERARLTAALAELEAARIGTIHSFC